ncbi:hypothetical protein Tco_0158317 [Tanacetum coccineum]
MQSLSTHSRSFKDGDGDGDTQFSTFKFNNRMLQTRPTLVNEVNRKRSHKGVKASTNSDIIFFFTSVQDGNKLLDDERLSLADDLKKAHDQNQNKLK